MRMKFKKLFQMFNDEEDRLADILSEIAEGLDEGESRKIFDEHTEALRNNDRELMLKVDAALGFLISAYMDVGFLAGFLFGQAFDMMDPEGLEEIHSLKARLEAEGAIRYWPREKKAPETPAKEDSGTSKQE